MNNQQNRRGFTLIEVLLASGIAVAVIGIAMGIIVSSQRVVQLDETRLSLAQNLRTGLDLVGNDVRQLGERLPSSFPALLITDGTSGASDELTVRRNLLSTTLPICANIAAASSNPVTVALPSTPAPSAICQRSDANGNGKTDNLEEWDDYRTAAGGSVKAFIYSPVTKLGEFFDYTAQNHTNATIPLSSGTWTNAYSAADQPFVLILEERRFYVASNILYLSVNRATGEPLVPDIVNFQATVTLDVAGTPTAATSVDASTDWKTLQAVRVSLSGRQRLRSGDVNRTLEADFLPRNVLSK
jgi:type II secretory pathway pseudopilin PulG